MKNILSIYFTNILQLLQPAVGFGQAPTNLSLQGPGALPTNTPFNLPSFNAPQAPAQAQAPLPKISPIDDLIQHNFLVISQKMKNKFSSISLF